MIYEKQIHVARQHHHCCLFHYLCIYPSMREKGYAPTLMNCVLREEGEMVNKKIYCVASLPKGYSRKIFSFQQEDIDRNDV